MKLTYILIYSCLISFGFNGFANEKTTSAEVTNPQALPPIPVLKSVVNKEEKKEEETPALETKKTTEQEQSLTEKIIEEKIAESKKPESVQSAASSVMMYNLARNYSSKIFSCELYDHLEKDKTFELKDLALVRVMQNCDSPTKEQFKRFWSLNTNKDFKWAYSVSRPLALKWALRKQDHRRIVFYTNRMLLNYRGSKKRHIKLIEQALPSFNYMIDISKGKSKDKYTQRKKDLETKIYNLSPSKADNLPEEKWFTLAREFENSKETDRAKEVYLDILANNWKFTPLERFKARAKIRSIKKTLFIKNKKTKKAKKAFLKESKRLMELAVNIIEHEDITNPIDKIYLSSKGAIEYFSDVNFYGKSSSRARKAIKKYLRYPKVVGLYKAYAYHYLRRISWIKRDWSRAYRESQKATIALLEELKIEPNLSKTTAIANAVEKNLWYSSRKYRKVAKFYEDTLWHYAFSARMSKRYKKSNTILEAMLKIFPSPENKPISMRKRIEAIHLKTLFWLGKNHLKLGSKSKARYYFKKVMAMTDDHWYSAWAHDLTRTKFIPFNKPTKKEKLTLPKNINITEYRRIKLLQDVGEKSLARAIIRKKLPVNSKVDMSPTAMSLRESAGNYIGNISAYDYFLNYKEKREYLQKNYRYIYPMPFKELVDKALKQVKNVFAGFVYSIMKQESHFVPQATSPVGALGLMQVMPNTAKDIYRKFGVDYNGKKDLLVPKKNIPLGVGYLSMGLQDFDNSFILTSIGYNAGPGNAKKWFKKYYTGDYHEFYERVPVPETQKYMGLATKNYIGYLKRSRKVPFLFPTLLKQMPRK